MDIRTLTNNELYLYDQLLVKAESAYIFQTRPYLDCLKFLNQEYEITGIFIDNELVYALPIQKKKIPLIDRYYYYVPMGVVSSRYFIPNHIVEEFTKYLMKKGIIIKLSLNQEFSNSNFKLEKYNTTLIIDLNKSLDDIFANFSKTHRNCTRKAEKDGVIVRIDKNINTINIFIELYEKLVKLKEIEAISIKFLKNVLTNLINNDLGFFAIAKYNDKIYNIAFISTVGKKARYLYGASLRIDEKLPPIGQLLHYEIIKYLKDNGFISYDFGGIPNLPVSLDDKAYSVYKFKKGFGGDALITSYEYVFTRYKALSYILH